MGSKELRKCQSPSFLGIDDIIAGQAKVVCKTRTVFKTFGFLDSDTLDDDLPVETVVGLPLWAAMALTSRKKQFISAALPKRFSKPFLQVLEADPVPVNLNAEDRFFFQSGLMACALNTSGGDFLGATLPTAFARRTAALFDSCTSTVPGLNSKEDKDEIPKIIKPEHLDPLEVKILNDSQNESRVLSQWLLN